MKIATVVGARPQFIKASMLSNRLPDWGINEVLIHTGQHFDTNMSDIFFNELGLTAPHIHLNIHSDTNTAQTARVMMALEDAFKKTEPHAVLVYGDTNATLAASLVGAQMKLPIIHVEAGLRSFDRTMPEEINRILTDQLSSLLFCPTVTAVSNLRAEGRMDGVYHVGDIMYDAVLHFSEIASAKSDILRRLGVEGKPYVLATIHRDFNTDNPVRLKEILAAFGACAETVVFPVHPRTKKMMAHYELHSGLDSPNIMVTEPLGYLDMLAVQANARVIVTDSGGVQKEAYFNGIPSVIVREHTEWVELVQTGWAKLVPAERVAIALAIRDAQEGSAKTAAFGDGAAGEAICRVIADYFR